MDVWIFKLLMIVLVVAVWPLVICCGIVLIGRALGYSPTDAMKKVGFKA